MRKSLVLATLAVGALTSFGAASTSATGAPHVAARTALVISTRKLPKLGTVLVDGKGRTLYMFVPDKRKKVTCVRTCAAIWPPVKLPKGVRVVARRRARLSLFGSDHDPAGGQVVTYSRWPLYTYIADTAPGQAKGQALNLNGGLWYVLAPSGKVIRTKA